MVPLRSLLTLYVRRLRGAWMAELLAAAGIATGVALVFSVVVTNSSITAAAPKILRAISGDAQLQLTARGPNGVSDTVVRRVRELDGVSAAAPLLEQRATVRRGDRRVAIDLVGIDADLADLGGVASSPLLAGFLIQPGLFLPGSVADLLGVPDDERTLAARAEIVVEVRGRAHGARLNGVLEEPVIGPLATGTIAGGPLAWVQQLTGLEDRVSRVLVLAEPGTEAAVRERLEQVAGGTMTVTTATAETQLLEQASAPNDQATSLFAAIGVIVGLLLTFTAMLLTVPERRRMVAELSLLGWPDRRVAQAVLFPALLLGVVASGAGLLAGDLLSRTAAHEPPGYLAFAFPLGIDRVVDERTVLIAFAAGVLVSLLAASQPLLDLRGRAATGGPQASAERGHSLAPRTRVAMAAAAALIVALTTAMVLLAPATTVVGVGLLALATLLALPAVFDRLLALARLAERLDRPSLLVVAARALRATSLRSLALAATAAIAVFGSVAIEGAHRNLLDGLYEDYWEYVDTADVWITQHGDDLALQPLDLDGDALREVPGVAAVRTYHGGLIDVGDRRVWLIARDRRDRTMVPPSQLLSGSLADATDRLRTSGWVTVSDQLADERGAAVGDTLTLPTPTGDRRYRIAATTTNLGWGPGAIVMNSADYRRAWATDTPTAIEIDVHPDFPVADVQAALLRELGPTASVRVQSVVERSEHANAVAREGLARLSQISLLLLIAAALAIAAAMGATLWQRRPALAQRTIDGFPTGKLWRSLLVESGLVVLAGCLTGALTGLYGHYLLGRWLEQTTGYPAPFDLSIGQGLLTCAFVAGVALAITAIPGWFAARAPAELGLRSET